MAYITGVPYWNLPAHAQILPKAIFSKAKRDFKINQPTFRINIKINKLRRAPKISGIYNL